MYQIKGSSENYHEVVPGLPCTALMEGITLITVWRVRAHTHTQSLDSVVQFYDNCNSWSMFKNIQYFYAYV